ncbi:hypothetical protein [Streptococcus sciuri]|uniref:MORN repeat protein n=1 Tax=Streptococcus sciuri TaxID=2973939 RepID=A0ABT2F8Y5_9STRE|nr:hypothetical protein [Streptococcus sciuri]MCS4488933.1 hypothetical protein [Streptococcus sciuri]
MKTQMQKQRWRFPSLSRSKWELLVVFLILICGFTVFSVIWQSKGTLVYNSTNGQITYTGIIVNHRINGQGQLTYPNGDIYKGHFANGIFNGQGTFIAKSGWSYTGEFSNGKPDGQGTLKAKDGKVYKGKFKQGIYQR